MLHKNLEGSHMIKIKRFHWVKLVHGKINAQIVFAAICPFDATQSLLTYTFLFQQIYNPNLLQYKNKLWVMVIKVKHLINRISGTNNLYMQMYVVEEISILLLISCHYKCVLTQENQTNRTGQYFKTCVRVYDNHMPLHV